MALLNRFIKLNDRGETGVFTFIVTKSVTRDFHRDATTKDFCFGYHRWAISFQRPSEKVLGVHLLLRNPSPNTSCLVDFTLTLLNREHFSQNEVYSKREAKFTITNPMQGVARWIQMSDLMERHFSDETGEFLFELSLSNMSTIFECDIQLNGSQLSHYKAMLKGPSRQHHHLAPQAGSQQAQIGAGSSVRKNSSELINLETNCFTFGSFDWSLTIVPLVIPSAGSQHSPATTTSSSSSSSSASGGGGLSGSAGSLQSAPASEPVCRVYLNRLSGFDALCRVKYRVILGHHQGGSPQPSHFADSRQLDQISDAGGRIRGHQFRQTNILKLVSLKQQPSSQQAASPSTACLLDLRVHIEMYCANTISEAKVPTQRPSQELGQLCNCSDRNKQAWSVESDCENKNLRLKLFFLDTQSVPRNHIRYISWIAYVVRRDSKGGVARESLAVRNAPHSNFYLRDGMDMGTLMDTQIASDEINQTPGAYLEDGQLTVHIEWVDSLLLFSHLYNNYDSLASVQRHQMRRELSALQYEFELLERKYAQNKRHLSQILAAGQQPPAAQVAATEGLEPQDQAADQYQGRQSTEGAQQPDSLWSAPVIGHQQRDAFAAGGPTAGRRTISLAEELRLKQLAAQPPAEGAVPLDNRVAGRRQPATPSRTASGSEHQVGQLRPAEGVDSRYENDAQELAQFGESSSLLLAGLSIREIERRPGPSELLEEPSHTPFGLYDQPMERVAPVPSLGGGGPCQQPASVGQQQLGRPPEIDSLYLAAGGQHLYPEQYPGQRQPVGYMPMPALGMGPALAPLGPPISPAAEGRRRQAEQRHFPASQFG